MVPVRSAALAAAVAAMLAAACSGDPALTYDSVFQAEFDRACVAGVGDDSGAETCGGWYERLTLEVPFEELPALEDLTAPEADEDVVDPELYEHLADCARAFGSPGGVPVTAPPPLTVPRSTTTTTALIAEG